MKRSGKEWLFIGSLCCVFLLLVSETARGEALSVGNVKTSQRLNTGTEVVLTSGARARVTIESPTLVRVRLAGNGRFEADWSYAVSGHVSTKTQVTVSETTKAIEIKASAGVRVTVSKHPFLVDIFDAQGQPVLKDDPTFPIIFNDQNGQFITTKLRPETETYYGFGEKALPLSRHGQVMAMWNTDTYAYPPGTDPIYQSIPFFIGLSAGKAYGLFFDNTHRTFFDMGRANPGWFRFGAAGGELNYYVFTGGEGRQPKEIVREYTELTGRTQVPPLWALGYQQSRWSYIPESRVRELARTFREKKIPCDTIFLDIDYMDGFRVFTWNKTHFPNPHKLISELKQQGFQTVVIIDPGIKVDETYPVYQDGKQRNLFVQDGNGQELHATVWPGTCAFPDFTNPAARLWFGEQYQAHLKEGLAGFWNDMNEPGVFPPDDGETPAIFQHPLRTFPLNAHHHGDGHPGTHARFHNVFGMQMARATFEALAKFRPEARPFVLTRAGYAGIQRYAAVWTGDNVASWDHLALTIPMLTNLGVSGVPLVGADVGGFSGNASPELYTRWLQTAALAPLMRTHSEHESADHEPWAFGASFESINRSAIELRYRCLPQLYSVFHEHVQTGVPVMRPLWFEFPQDGATYVTDDVFLVGADLLVAPVLKDGVRQRSVRFPKGSNWIDWWSGTLSEGGKTVTVPAPLERLPMFVRAGRVLLNQPVVQHTGEMPRQPLSLIVGAGQDGETTLFDDVPDGPANQVRTFHATISGGSVTLRSRGIGSGRKFEEVVVLNVAEAPQTVWVNEHSSAKFAYDKTVRKLRIWLPSFMDSFTIKWK